MEFVNFFYQILSKKQTTTEFLKNFCGAYGFGSCLTFIIFINDCFLFDVCFSFAWVKSRMLLVIFLLARLIKQPILQLRFLIFLIHQILFNKTWRTCMNGSLISNSIKFEFVVSELVSKIFGTPSMPYNFPPNFTTMFSYFLII